MMPKTRFAKSGELRIAYQVLAKGPLDLVYVPGWISHVEPAWEEPTLARFLNRLSSFSRLIMFDKRGTGLPQARYVELTGDGHFPWVGDQDAIIDEVQEFLTGVRPAPEVDRVLATLLFTDMVGSTDLAARLGDRGWKELLDRHHSIVRKELDPNFSQTV
jgi:hypothetical protein